MADAQDEPFLFGSPAEYLACSDTVAYGKSYLILSLRLDALSSFAPTTISLTKSQAVRLQADIQRLLTQEGSSLASQDTA